MQFSTLYRNLYNVRKRLLLLAAVSKFIMPFTLKDNPAGDIATRFLPLCDESTQVREEAMLPIVPAFTSYIYDNVGINTLQYYVLQFQSCFLILLGGENYVLGNTFCNNMDWYIATILENNKNTAPEYNANITDANLQLIFADFYTSKPVNSAPQITVEVPSLIWTVRMVAKQIYDEQDFGSLPVLADMLTDAGYHDSLTEHFRNHPCHQRGCWALDLLLFKA